MPPKVPLIIPERKLLNFCSVCWEAESSVFVPSSLMGRGRAPAASCAHPQHSQARQGHGERDTGWLWVLGTSWWSRQLSQDTLWRLEAPKSSVPWEGRGPQLCSASPQTGAPACPIFQAACPWQFFVSVIFSIFVIFVFLIEGEIERLGLTLCFCTVIFIIRRRYKGMLNPGDSSQQTCDKSHLIS